MISVFMTNILGPSSNVMMVSAAYASLSAVAVAMRMINGEWKNEEYQSATASVTMPQNGSLVARVSERVAGPVVGASVSTWSVGGRVI